MNEITKVCLYKGYLYFYDEDETIEIKADYKVYKGYGGDWNNPPEPAELEITKIIYCKENGVDIPFNEKEIINLIDDDLCEKALKEIGEDYERY